MHVMVEDKVKDSRYRLIKKNNKYYIQELKYMFFWTTLSTDLILSKAIEEYSKVIFGLGTGDPLCGGTLI